MDVRISMVLVLSALAAGCASPRTVECDPPESPTCKVWSDYFVHIHDVAIMETPAGGVRASFTATAVHGSPVVVEYVYIFANGGGDSRADARPYPGNLSGLESRAFVLDLAKENATEPATALTLHVSYSRPEVPRTDSVSRVSWTSMCHRLQGDAYVLDRQADPNGGCDPEDPRFDQGLGGLYGIEFTWPKGTSFLAPPEDESWRGACPHCYD